MDTNNEEVSDTIEDTTEEISDLLLSIRAISLPNGEGTWPLYFFMGYCFSCHVHVLRIFVRIFLV